MSIIIAAVHIAYYMACPRRMWLFHYHIRMEHSSDLVYTGKIIEENSYQQRSEQNRQLELRARFDTGTELVGIIDYFDPVSRIIYETKKSYKKEEAHIAQVRFYQLLLKENGLEDVRAVIEYPLLRKSVKVPSLDIVAESRLREDLRTIIRLLRCGRCPQLLRDNLCRQCAYFEYCYAGEEEIAD
ncbi:MAG: Dna2/Cas4 domain-containing protein [Methanobacteriota archaeon]|nr:MAG: Dna2/Cas4 domain-containing protein [Euryarchaeota archaeon]